MELNCYNFTTALEIFHTTKERIHTSPLFDICTSVPYRLVFTNFLWYWWFLNDWKCVYFRKLVETDYLLTFNKSVSVIQIESTWLGDNKWYQFIFASILNTTFATIIPVVLLFFLNISTVLGKFWLFKSFWIINWFYWFLITQQKRLTLIFLHQSDSYESIMTVSLQF